MNIETTPREDHQVTLTVELKQERMDRAKKRAAREISKKNKIPGFRPGKVPYPVVVRQFGEQAIIERAVDILLDDVYPKALEEAEIEPSAPGSLEEMESIDPPKFVFTVPLRPEVDLGDYRSLREAYKFVKPNEKEVDARLEELQQMNATLVSVDRPIENNDYVLVKVVGKKADAEEGEDSIVFEKESHAAHVQEKERENEEPFTGFAKLLVGMRTGESKTLSKEFPKDYQDESLQGATVEYEVTINSVQGEDIPALNDDFAKTLGAGDTLEELRELIAKELEMKSREEYDDEYYSAVFDKLKEGATIKYPPQVLDREAEEMLEEVKNSLAQKNLEFETYLKMEETTLEKFTEEKIRPAAQKQLERGLIFDQLVDMEKIKVSDSELQEVFSQKIYKLSMQGYDLNEVEGGKRAQREIVNNIAIQSAAQVSTRKLLKRLKDIATGEQKKKEAAEKEAAKKAETEAEAKEIVENEESVEKAEDTEEKTEE